MLRTRILLSLVALPLLTLAAAAQGWGIAGDVTVLPPAAPPPTVVGVDLTQVVLSILGIAGAVLTVVATHVVKLIGARFGVAIDIDKTAVLDNAIRYGLDLAKARILGPDGKVTVQVENELVRQVISYVADKVPDTLKHFGMSADDPRLKEMILARMAAWLPVTPNV